MKKFLLNVIRAIVGPEHGFTRKGSEQWYYFLALVMNSMLTWWFIPEIGTLFTTASIIHYISVCIYGIEWIKHDNIVYSIVYYFIHLIIFTVCMLTNWAWTILTSFIVTAGFFFAPNRAGDNVLIHSIKPDLSVSFGNIHSIAILFFNSIWFAIFVNIALNHPIDLWIRLTIIAVCILLHPVIDMLEDKLLPISYVTKDSFLKIVESISI